MVGSDTLADMLAAQRELQIESFKADPAEMFDPAQRAEFIRWNLLACARELFEALEEAPTWKPWSTSTDVNDDAFLGELVDAWHFFMNLMWVTYGQGVLGDAHVLAEVFAQKYYAKRQVNAKRQVEGYDGVSGKCTRCRRDLREIGVMSVGDAQQCRGCGEPTTWVDSASAT